MKKKISKNQYLHTQIYSSRCKRISLTCEQGDMECYRRPASITYHFITLVSNMSLPPTGRVLFTYKGPSWYENIDFDMKILHAQAPANIRRVSDKYFRYFNLLILFETIDLIFGFQMHISVWTNSKTKHASVWWRVWRGHKILNWKWAWQSLEMDNRVELMWRKYSYLCRNSNIRAV